MWGFIIAAPLYLGAPPPFPVAPQAPLSAPAWQAAPMPYSQPRLPPVLPPGHPSLMIDPGVMRPR